MKIIISCSASPDFVKKWKRCIESQKLYCKKYGYDYVVDDRPLLEGQTNNEWTWKKHYTLDQYENTHDLFVAIDADCEIKKNTPPIESVLNDNSIYYVLGVSKRPNAGFMIFRNDSVRKYFHTELKKRRLQPVPPDFRVKLSGDNGHVIWILSEMTKGLQELPLQWNCSQPSHIDDAYILHYTNHLRGYYNDI
jgi:hypothetical protein